MEENKFKFICDQNCHEFEQILWRLCHDKDWYIKLNAQENINYNTYYCIDQRTLSQEKNLLNNDLLSLLKNNEKFFIMIYSAHESIDDKNFKFIKKYTLENNINQNKIYLVNNCANLKELQIKNSTNFNLHKLNVLTTTKIYDMMSSKNGFFRKNKEGKFFMTFNKEDKRHRYALLIFLKKNNLLDFTNWSYLPTNKRKISKQTFSPIMNEKDIEMYLNEIEYFNNLSYKYSDYEINYDNKLDQIIETTMLENFDNYENSYINLTTESVFDEREDVVHITEKSFKPFYYYQFPLILSSENHIKKMKELYDFDFFDDIINHDYDNIVDDIERFEKYTKEVLRIYQNKDLFIEFYNKNQDRFEKNKEKVKKIMKMNDNDYNYFLNLI